MELVKHPVFDCYATRDGKIFNSNFLELSGGNSRYKSVNIKTPQGFKRKSIHTLIVETFIGEIPKNMMCNHINGNKLDNRVENLEIVTPSQNTQHAYDNGLAFAKKGEEHYAAILTDEKVIAIYKEIKKFKNNNEISILFGIPFRLVSLIRNGSRWKHLFEVHMIKIIPSLNLNTSLFKIMKIIETLNTTNLTNTEIGKLFEEDQSTISRARNRKTWLQVFKHYEEIKKVITIKNN